MYKFVRLVAQASFSLFLVITFTTPSWRYGMFSWWPVMEFEEVAGAPVKLGILNFLPVVVVVAWGLSVVGGLLWGNGRISSLTLGPPGMVTPFVLLTLWALMSLDPAFPRLVFIHVGGILLAWLTYFYVINERPFLPLPLSVIVVGQSLVALGQFFKQEGLELVDFGELPLNPAWIGITVLYARNTRWLRAYGLTAHPNLLGAILVMFLLLLLPAYMQARNWRQVVLGVVGAMGLMGLFVTFSRAAWLAFLVGLAVWFALNYYPVRFISRATLFKLILPALPTFLLLPGYYDLALSRLVALDTPIETRSIEQREVDTNTAVEIIQQNTWFGVGLGNYVDAADRLNSISGSIRVHNVPLLVTAELGLVGLVLWLWLMAAPFWYAWKSRQVGKFANGQVESHKQPDRLVNPSPAIFDCNHLLTSSPLLVSLPLWLAMLLINQFDTMVWLSSNWQTAVLFALLVAVAAEPWKLYRTSGIT